MPLGYHLKDRSSQRVWGRGMLLAVLFVPVVAWNVILWYNRSGGEDFEAPVALDEFDFARRLNASNTTTTLGPSFGYDCLSHAEWSDRKNNNLRMIPKSDTTMNGCLSGEGPCLRQGKEWLLVLYIPVMFYMFVALAIICDEFFVPSLEMFVEHYEISMDIAGATFMAAGGSMPELFTSLFAVLDESDVGFAAIVGSAVFNVLFVIAVCALASKEPLVLTAWPLARDCSFYIVALALIVVFFAGVSPNQIYWWEALILFFWYLIYCSFMTVNGKVKGIFDRMRGKGAAVTPEPGAANLAEITAADLDRKSNVNMRMPSTFRSGVIKLLTQHSSVSETAGIAVVLEMKCSLQEAFKEMDQDGDGHIDENEFNKFMQKLGWHPPSDDEIRDIKEDAASKLWKRMPLSSDDKLAFEDFRKWYTVSEARIEIEVRSVFDKLDRNGDGRVDKDEIAVLLNVLGHHPTQQELAEVLGDIAKFSNPDHKELTPEEAAKISVKFDQFEKWYTQSLFCEAHQRKHQVESVEDEGFVIDWPKEDSTWSQFFWYFFTYPLCAAMYCSLPDVRRSSFEGKVHWAIIEFILSLVWIALFSNVLYEATIVSSNTIGIPPPVAAVTILAAGTSVPDLISSYIVARQGLGDMAVSSSIGSNIFDVTVGLPIPWMLYSAISNGAPVTVGTSSLGFSVLVLMLMLAAVIFTVMLMKWRMTRGLGAIMFVLYFVFLAQDLLQQLPKGNPVLNLR